MLVLAGILVIWVLAALAAVALCAAARRGDRELAARPVLLQAVDGHTAQQTRAS